MWGDFLSIRILYFICVKKACCCGSIAIVYRNRTRKTSFPDAILYTIATSRSVMCAFDAYKIQNADNQREILLANYEPCDKMEIRFL